MLFWIHGNYFLYIFCLRFRCFKISPSLVSISFDPVLEIYTSCNFSQKKMMGKGGEPFGLSSIPFDCPCICYCQEKWKVSSRMSVCVCVCVFQISFSPHHNICNSGAAGCMSPIPLFSQLAICNRHVCKQAFLSAGWVPWYRKQGRKTSRGHQSTQQGHLSWTPVASPKKGVVG